MISYGDNVPNECQHGQLSSKRDKGWLKGATPPHDALIKIVMGKHFGKYPTIAIAGSHQ